MLASSLQFTLMDSYLASERICFWPHSYNHQHRQPVSYLRSVPSYSQRICYLTTLLKNLL